MNVKPRITVIMGTFNRAHLLGQAIESLLGQTFSDWRLIIADDGSSDRTPAEADQWMKLDDRIAYFRNDVNVGISRNYNQAFLQADTDYIAMLDDDDAWCLNEKLALQVRYLDTHPESVGCGGGVIVVDPQGNERYRYLKPETDAQIRASMLFANPMANSTTLFRRTVGEQVGWYDGSMRYCGDRDFWMKMARTGKLYNFPEFFSFYTMGEQNTSIAHIKPHLRASLMLTRRYARDFPKFPLAIAVNYVQYCYAFLPRGVTRHIHTSAARLKRAVAG
jgi:glycosyltransferase involved in cell wall biosynthesis